ncbi:hypothetical protein K501DRAFT_336231 [Backusella circina FSU 941]|nr:hypothetical protein K501DRAFT_336231 [Backusella circina FSU 941]
MPQKKRANGRRSEPKLFRCTGFGDCNMVFTRSEHLARHARKHTGEKPFKCVVPSCDRMFSRFDNMMQHTHTHSRTKKKGSPELSDDKKSPMSLPDDMMMPKSPGNYHIDPQLHYSLNDHRYLQLPLSRRTSLSSSSSGGIYQPMGNHFSLNYHFPDYYQSLPASPTSEEDYHHHQHQPYYPRAHCPLPPINNDSNQAYSHPSSPSSATWSPAYYHTAVNPPSISLPPPPHQSPPYSLPTSALPSPGYSHHPDSSISSMTSTAAQTPKTTTTTVDYFSSRTVYHKPHSIASTAFGAAVMGNYSKNDNDDGVLDTPMTQLRKRLSYFDLSTPIHELGSTAAPATIKEESVEEDDTDNEHPSPSSSLTNEITNDKEEGVDITEDEYEALQGFGKFCTEPIILEKQKNASTEWKETLKLPSIKNLSPTTLSSASLPSQVHAFRQNVKVIEESFQRPIRHGAF